MKILKFLGVIFLLSITILNYGCISCSKSVSDTGNDESTKYYPPPDCGSACLYSPYAYFSRSIEKTSRTLSFGESIGLGWGAYAYLDKGYKDITKVAIEGKNIDKYNPVCGQTTSPIKGEEYSKVYCTLSYINLSDFSNQDTYILKVTTSSYGELNIDVPLSNVKFLAPVHITSPFDSNTLTDKSQLPVKVALNNGSFTLTWDDIPGANYFNIQSPSLNLDEYFKQSGLISYTFKNVEPGLYNISIIATNTERSPAFDKSSLFIEIEAQ